MRLRSRRLGGSETKAEARASAGGHEFPGSRLWACGQRGEHARLKLRRSLVERVASAEGQGPTLVDTPRLYECAARVSNSTSHLGLQVLSNRA